ncbi:MAG: non-canonical purine NTP pyrophosphatase [Candidatus Micrarchaeota archaeon]
MFIPNGEEKTYGELGLKEKAKYSHRAKAFKALADYLKMK